MGWRQFRRQCPVLGPKPFLQRLQHVQDAVQDQPEDRLWGCTGDLAPTQSQAIAGHPRQEPLLPDPIFYALLVGRAADHHHPCRADRHAPKNRHGWPQWPPPAKWTGCAADHKWRRFASPKMHAGVCRHAARSAFPAQQGHLPLGPVTDRDGFGQALRALPAFRETSQTVDRCCP